MADDVFSGSDEARSTQYSKYVRWATFDEPLALENGEKLPSVTVAYETYGELSPEKDNAVLICHALTGDSHVSAHDENDEPGWWDIARLVGKGCPIDTNRYFVICPNVLGGCRGTTGPNCINPKTGKPYGKDFPNITIGDMAEVQRRLVAHLGVEKLLAVVGGSMGGHMALSWAVKFPDQVESVVALATSPRLSTQSLAFDVVGRNAIRQDPHYADGQYYDQPAGPDVGLAIARMLGHITYLSPIAMSEKFDATRDQPKDVKTDFEKEFSVGSYLAYKGQQFTERFDANSYLALSMAMDQFDLGRTVEELARAFAAGKARWLVVSFTSDWLFPSFQSKQIVRGLLRNGKGVTYCDVESHCGHDAFLLVEDVATYGELVRAFLRNALGAGRHEPLDARWEDHSPTSIFHQSRRLDYDTILKFIPPDTSVLDLGCGTGGLLSRLREQGHTRLSGVEIDQRNILACARRGLDVVHRDLNKGLEWYTDKQFDVVVLSRTLQAVYDVEHVMDEILRVGRKCVVSVPNFGYYKLQDMLQREGKAPEAGVLRFKWYNTPNIRVLTIRDFEDFCAAKGITIHDFIALDTEEDKEIPADRNPNRNADMAVFVISR
ncbi:MAG: homoserine O-acetyltransferase [Phycisphaerae bacterium]|nr:homoserine O-acetyltransferase [Phycisphaerae bacterium]